MNLDFVPPEGFELIKPSNIKFDGAPDKEIWLFKLPSNVNFI
jgi:hypothetical protein